MCLSGVGNSKIKIKLIKKTKNKIKLRIKSGHIIGYTKNKAD